MADDETVPDDTVPDGATPGDATPRDAVKSASRGQGERELGNLSLDPTQAQESDPESWDEQPASDDDAAKYLIDKPPHHGS